MAPLLGRSRSQVAQRTDRMLTGSLGGVNGFNQKVVRIGLAFVFSGAPSQVHLPLYISLHPHRVKIKVNYVSHYFRISDIRWLKTKDLSTHLPRKSPKPFRPMRKLG